MNNNEQHYFLTYGRGVFKFMLNELKFEFNSVLKIEEETELTEGKFHFILVKTTTNYLKSLLNLKTVERVFLSILFEKLNPHENTEIETLLNLIQNSIQNSNLNQNDQFQLIIENKQIDPSAKRIALPIKFRINCKLRGKWKNLKHLKHLKQLIIDKLIQQIELINLRFKYSDDNDYNFEIICHLNDISLLIGIPISKEPLSKRDYIIHSGLRSTTCAIMIQLAEINTCLDTFILDPFSGVNTILTEYYGSNKDSNLIYISSDSNINQLHLSQQNLSQFNSNLICSNLNFQLPYRNNIFDLIITGIILITITIEY